MIEKNPARRLSIFYNGIILANAALFFIFLVILSYMQFSTFRSNELRVAGEEIQEKSHDLDYVLLSASSHVEEMKLWAEDYLRMSGGSSEQSPLMKNLTNVGDGYYSLDEYAPEPGNTHGNLFGMGVVSELSPQVIQEQSMALWLLEMMKINHQTAPYFTWSFYLSKNNFAANYPWVTVDYMIAQTPNKKLVEIFEHSYNGDHWKSVTPEVNPDRLNVWRGAYVDNLGKELVVTNVSSVYRGDEFLGAVAADIQLAFLSRFTSDVETSHGITAVVNDMGQVLSYTNFAPEGLKDVPTVEEILPASTGIIISNVIKEKKQVFSKPGNNNLIVYPLRSAPWALVQVIPERDIVMAFIPTVKYYGLVLLALTAYQWQR